jgi:acetylglutamate kinase
MRSDRWIDAVNISVIKIGGALIQDRAKIGETIRGVVAGPTVLVHGGGIQITRLLERFGVSSSFIDGLRVTDEATLQVAALALAGEVHTQLVQTLVDAGIPAIGIFGAVRAAQRPGPLGFVGGDLKVDSGALDSLIQAGKIPVIPTLALGVGTLLNVNGDETAAAVAISLGAERLIFMTDVPGVKDASGEVIDSVADPDELLHADFVSGGMIPKLRSVSAALAGGVRTVLVGQTRFGS